jgi:tetratricopeptide (TPR) repeat protein
VPPVGLAQPGEEPGKRWKYAIAVGLAVLALGTAYLGFQRVVGEPDALARPTATAVATATPSPPTATPGPTGADLFLACEQAVAAADWAAAAPNCERVGDSEPGYPRLADALATTYLALGKERLAAGGPLTDALEYFERALTAKPDDAEAAQQRQWALAYQEGEAALVAESWATAAQKLGQVYAVAPDYRSNAPDGGVKSQLYAARMGWGQALLRAGDYAEAQRRCEQALELAPESEEAGACRQAAVVALATPTPRPTPAPPPPTPVLTQPQQQTPRQVVPTTPARQQPAPAPTQAPAQAPATRAPAPPVQAPATRPPFTPQY